MLRIFPTLVFTCVEFSELRCFWNRPCVNLCKISLSFNCTVTAFPQACLINSCNSDAGGSDTLKILPSINTYNPSEH